MTEEKRPDEGKDEKPDTGALDGEAIYREVTGEHIPAGDPAGPEPEPQIDGAELWATIWSVGFSIIGARRGDHWQLSSAEAVELGKATDPVARKYLPDFDSGPEATLMITAAMVLMPRMAADRQRRQAPPAAGGDDAGQS